MITLTLETTKYKRGRGFWKLNCSLLQDKNYVEMIKNTISETVQENCQAHPALLWDTVKCKIRGASIAYSSKKQRNVNKVLDDLENKITELNAEYNRYKSEEILSHLEETKTLFFKEMENKTKGAIIRSKCRYAELGEKNTNYFLSMEKRNFNKKVINKLLLDNGKEICKETEILEALKIFYEKLYESDEQVALVEHTKIDPFFNNLPKLSEEHSVLCEDDLTENEVYSCLKTFETGKSPGSDGLPAEWYLTFWQDIKQLVLNSFLYSRSNGHLSITQKQGIMTLLPKKDKDPLKIKNWRPISLLNTDYKILSKCIANHIKKILHNIIHYDQTGFLQGRYIGENIIKILALLDYCAQNEVNGYLITVDFEKAFDYLEHSHIHRCLKYFGFGPKILNWISVLYNDAQSCVINNGWFSSFFKLHRGVRQGCPLSPYIFILSVECLAHSVRSNTTIQGIMVGGIEHKMSQYADDTSLTLADNFKSIQEMLKIFEDFRQISGLKINKEKTICMPMRAHEKYKKEIQILGLKWAKSSVSILGIFFSDSMSEICKINYGIKLQHIKKIVYAWEHRKLTLMGKIVIVKSLILSQLIYLLSVLPNPPEDYFKEIDQILYKFIWDGKNEKIKRQVLMAPKREGGLNMIHVKTQSKALKLLWVKRLLTVNIKVGWRQLVDQEFCNLTDFIFKCNLNRKHVPQVKLKLDPFWSEVFMYWCDYNFISSSELQLEARLLKQVIWFNSVILQGQNILCWKKFYSKGILTIEDLVKKERHESVKFLTLEQVNTLYNVEMNFLEYEILIRCIPDSWKRSIISLYNIENDPLLNQYQYKADKIKTLQKGSRDVYKELIKPIYSAPEKIIKHWEKELGIGEAELQHAFTNIYFNTNFVKLRFFQYKMLHRCLSLNNFLWKAGIVNSNKCSFCLIETETTIHLFYECNIVKNLWL